MIVGIDFGNLLCRTAACLDGRVEPFSNRFSERPLPLSVEFTARAETPTPVSFRGLKQMLGIEERFLIPSGPVRVLESVAGLLWQIREDADTASRGGIRGAVLSVPAFYQDRRRVAVRDAALRGGFPAVRLVDEAVAVLTGSETTPAEGVTLVYALGAGLFSATIVRVVRGRPKVLSAEGDVEVGGLTFDSLLLARLLDRLGKDVGSLASDPERAVRVRAVVEQVKISLSRHEEEELDLNLTDLFPGGENVRLLVRREEFETAIRGAVEQTVAVAGRALESAGLPLSAMDRVLLIGGSTRIPLVERRLEELFQTERRRAGDYDIARGAALFGSQISEDAWINRDALDPPPIPTPAPPPPPPERHRPPRAPALQSWTGMFEPYLQRAATAWARQDHTQAICAVEEMLKAGAGLLGTLHAQRGEARYLQGNFAEAIDDFRKALARSPGDTLVRDHYHRTLGHWAAQLLKDGRLMQARTTIHDSLQLGPECQHCRQLAAQIEEAIRSDRDRRARDASRGKRRRR